VWHPEFYLPFAGTGMVVMAAAVAVAWALPPLWQWSPWPALSAVLLVVGTFGLPSWRPVLVRLQRLYEELTPSRERGEDGARWGMLAFFAIHATLARGERPVRRNSAAMLGMPPGPFGPQRGPVVMAQLESFFDPRRLHPGIPRDSLPGYDFCRNEASGWGPLAVPTWGANTIRTEFAALTGLEPAALRMDRFNPYDRFARTRVNALDRRMQALGYRTVCLHPFDTRFYGRHRATPALGFQRFIGPEAFSPAARAEAFANDAALARKAGEVVADEGPDVCLFVIPVGNHGPWLADRCVEDAMPAPLRALAEADRLLRAAVAKPGRVIELDRACCDAAFRSGNFAGARRRLDWFIGEHPEDGWRTPSVSECGTIERRWGAKIKARGIYRDPVRSSKGHFVKTSGLRWLSLMVAVPIPWANRKWAKLAKVPAA
jgi:hypothetical protein